MPDVLITSISKKVPLLKAVKSAIKGSQRDSIVIGADIDPSCIGRHFVDKFWDMPSISNLSVEELVVYCRNENVSAIIPTRDGELNFFSKNRDFLEKSGIRVMVSPLKGVELADDKLKFSELISGTIPTACNIGEIDAEFFVVKERYGAGSCSIGLRLSKEDALTHAEKLKDPVFQPYISGKEISVDIFLSKDGNVHGVVCRERNLVINGESQITSTFRDEMLERVSAELAVNMGLSGHVMFQFLNEKQTNTLYLLECNPRFGGASTASLQVGLNSFYWFFLEVLGRPLPPFDRISHEIKMVRHAEDLFIDC